MWPISAAAARVLADGNATIANRVEVWPATGGHLPDVGGVDWTVGYDTSSDVYAKGQSTFADPALWSGGDTDPLTPYGSEFALHRGIVMADDQGHRLVEWIPMGVFVPTDVTDSLPTLDGSGIVVPFTDRVAYMDDNPLDQGAKSSAGETILAFVTRMIRECPRLATVEIVDRSGGRANVPCPVVDLDVRRVVNVHKFLKSVGLWFRFDRLGRGSIAPIALADSAPIVWELRDGEGGTFIRGKRKVSREKTYSKVTCVQTVKESGDSAPVAATGTSINTDPSSPTFHGPKFARSHTYTSPLWTTNDQCAAQAELYRRLSIEAGRTLEVTHLPMEALDGEDAVRIKLRSGVRQVQIVQSFSVGAKVSAGPQVLGARGIETPADADDSLAAAAAQAADSAA